MNNQPGLIGLKVGQTQVFDTDGNVQRVTVLEVGPCTVTTKRAVEKEGYSAVQLGFGEKPERLVGKPQRGMYEKEGSPLKGTRPHRCLREVRVPKETAATYDVGSSLTVGDVFAVGDFVDVTGISKGKGFQGVVKRHGMHGADGSHGTHEYFRHGGSIGQNMTPGHTWPGMKMPGHMGSRRQTVQNLKVVEIIPEKNLILVRGGVPGSRQSLIMVRKAVKKSTLKKRS